MWILSLEKVKKYKCKKKFLGTNCEESEECSECSPKFVLPEKGMWWVLTSSCSAEHSSDVRLLVWWSNVHSSLHFTALRKLYETP